MLVSRREFDAHVGAKEAIVARLPGPKQMAPASASTPPRPDTEEEPLDARSTLPPDPAEEAAMSGFVPVEGHPGFYRIPSGAITFRFRDRRGQRRWASAPTIKAAERKRVELELAVERGDHQGSKERFDVYARAWLDTYEGRTARGINETTRDDYRRRIEQEAIPFFGRMRLIEIGPQDVKAYARDLEKPNERGGGQWPRAEHCQARRRPGQGAARYRV